VSFAFDTESNQIILFGGATAGGSFGVENGETWAYDISANQWKQMNPPSGPPALVAPSLAYDSESDRVIMFGGATGSRSTWGVADTWAYNHNTNTWTKMADGPGKHLGARIAYEVESDRIILFGGINPNTFDYYDDTWAYDYNSDTWTDMQPKVSPPGRNYQSITYDAKADRVLTWGGTDVYNQPVGDSIWSYNVNSNSWQELNPGEDPHPNCRDYSTMAYDAESDRSILVGGVPLGAYKDFGIWAYDYNTNAWLELKPNEEPGKVAKHHLAYISTIDRVFLFGGEFGDKSRYLSNDIWVYDFNSNNWEMLTPLP
jgi:N-acetylneuraminic acid mutarotase